MTGKEALEGMGKQAAAQGASELVGAGIGHIFRPTSAIEKLSLVGDVHPRTIQKAWDEMQATAKAGDKKVLTVGDYLGALKATKQRIGNEVALSLRAPVRAASGEVPLATAEADTTPISDAHRIWSTSIRAK